MTADRIKEIQTKTAFPDSVSVCQALFQVWNECQEDMTKEVEHWQLESEHWYQQAIEMTDKYNELLNKQD
jgi:hypothetical protein